MLQKNGSTTVHRQTMLNVLRKHCKKKKREREREEACEDRRENGAGIRIK